MNNSLDMVVLRSIMDRVNRMEEESIFYLDRLLYLEMEEMEDLIDVVQPEWMEHSQKKFDLHASAYTFVEEVFE